MDVAIFDDDIYTGTPPGVRLSFDEDHEPCGWFWWDRIKRTVVVGADVIASFLLISVQRERDDKLIWSDDPVSDDPE